MTLTELRYVVAVAREKHFGRAAEACFVSQPTLSVSIKKLEEELDVRIFERGANEVSVTPIGEEIVRQAQAVIEQAAQIKETAKRRKDPLSGPLSLGVIYTIGPYLLPDLVRQAIERVPQMPLVLQENFTAKLLELLRAGELDCGDHGRAVPRHRPGDRAALRRAVHGRACRRAHPLAKRKAISADELKQEKMLLLGTGHCFRDHVLEVCPEYAQFSPADAEGIRKTFEGSSLETIKYMVASGMGVTVVPQLSVPDEEQAHIAYVPFTKPAPTRRVVLAWRRSFTRYEAIAALAQRHLRLRAEGRQALTGVSARPIAARRQKSNAPGRRSALGYAGRNVHREIAMATTAPRINIGIDEADRAAIVGGLSKLLADTYTLYLTTHNFHWNVTGPMFNTLHLMFMTQYTELWNAVDPVAERIRSLGHPAPGSYAQFGRLSSIKDVPETPPKALEMVGDPGRRPRGGRAHRARHLPARREGRRRADRRPADAAPRRSTSRPPGCCAACSNSAPPGTRRLRAARRCASASCS